MADLTGKLCAWRANLTEVGTYIPDLGDVESEGANLEDANLEGATLERWETQKWRVTHYLPSSSRPSAKRI